MMIQNCVNIILSFVTNNQCFFIVKLFLLQYIIMFQKQFVCFIISWYKNILNFNFDQYILRFKGCLFHKVIEMRTCKSVEKYLFIHRRGKTYKK